MVSWDLSPASLPSALSRIGHIDGLTSQTAPHKLAASPRATSRGPSREAATSQEHNRRPPSRVRSRVILLWLVLCAVGAACAGPQTGGPAPSAVGTGAATVDAPSSPVSTGPKRITA